MGRGDELRRRLSGIASLFGRETNPRPEGIAVSEGQLYTTDYDVSRPPDNTEAFHNEFEANPFLNRPINAFVEEVVEPGWWFTGASESVIEETEEFGRNLGIAGGQPHRGLTETMRLMARQHIVRGTFLGEMVRDEQGRHVAINPINPETVEIYTRPNQALILPPDYDDSDEPHLDADLKHTDDGDVAGFVQYDQGFDRWQKRKERRFARDEILHWPRDPDVGDVFGHSVVEPVYDRAVALRQKLSDNDDAITMKAWPMVLFQLGTPERPFTKEQQAEFMDNYADEHFGPGMYHGVPGDVDIEEFAGETADIKEHVNTDVDYILAGMPGPKFTLGSFEDDIADTVVKAEERRFKKTVRAIRRDLENLLTPYFRRAVGSWMDSADVDDLQLHVGRPEGEVAPEDVNGSTIRYTSNTASSQDDAVDVEGDTGQTQEQESNGRSGQSDADTGRSQRGPSTVPDPEDGTLTSQRDTTTVTAQLASPSVDTPVWETAELADPRLVSTSDAVSTVAETIVSVLIDTREAVAGRLAEDGGRIEDVERQSVVDHAHRVGQDIRRTNNTRTVVMDALTSAVQSTLDTLGQESHAPQIETRFGPRHTKLVDDQTEQIRLDVDQLVRELGYEFATQIHTIDTTASVDVALERVRAVYGDDVLRNRAELFAQMQVARIVNETKLGAYRRADDVVGVGITNPCTDATTRLCRDLAGCDGGRATAMFDDEQRIGAQLATQTTVDPFTGFDPLGIPPFHFGCRSELVPVTTSS